MWQQDLANPERAYKLIASGRPTVDGQYVHWDELVRYPPPEGLNHEEWWFAIRWSRRALDKLVPLRDVRGREFRYVLIDPFPESLHQIDLGGGGFIRMPEPLTNPDTRDQYFVSSLIEEAITSSQLEGATTTRPVAKEMIKTGRAPRDRSERMILNNFLTMQRKSDVKAQPLTPGLVFELHCLVTDQALDDPAAVGRFRRADEHIVVGDDYGEVREGTRVMDRRTGTSGAHAQVPVRSTESGSYGTRQGGPRTRAFL